MEEAGEGPVIVYGRYRFNAGAYRPSLTAYVFSSDGRWVKHSFLLDTGADVTFLPRSSIAMLGINIAAVSVKDDVSGIGGRRVPYYDNFNANLIDPDSPVGFAEVFVDNVCVNQSAAPPGASICP